MQATTVGAIRDVHHQCFLTPTNRAVVRYWPVKLCQVDEALYKANGLTQWQAEQAFDGQAKLDSSIAEGGYAAAPLDMANEFFWGVISY